MSNLIRDITSDGTGPVRFEDAGGVSWEVREIEQPELKASTSGAGLAFGEFGRGWLVFTSDHDEKRRLAAPFPAHWRGLSSAELEQWCQRAKPAFAVGASAPREPAG